MQFDPDAPGAETLRGQDDDAPVARPEVVDAVVCSHARELQHGRHNALRSGREEDVRLAGWACGRLREDQRRRDHGSKHDWLPCSPQAGSCRAYRRRRALSVDRLNIATASATA